MGKYLVVEIRGIGDFGYFEVPRPPSFYPDGRNEDQVRSIVRDGCWKDEKTHISPNKITQVEIRERE